MCLVGNLPDRINVCNHIGGVRKGNHFGAPRDKLIQIVDGQAAGFLNMMAEGMSCALHSGAIAGEAIADAARLSRPLQEIYREMIQSEVIYWFAILVAVNLQTSFLTPPFGFALFYLRGVAPPTVKTSDIYRGVVPFIIIQLLLMALLVFMPELALWLPSLLYS